MRRIRILEKKKKAPTFGETLEERARRLAKRVHDLPWVTSPPSVTKREIALTLDHITRFRDLHEHLRRSLVRLECYIHTELLQLDPHRPVYRDERFVERDKLKRRLFKIEEERRRLAVQKEERLQGLHERLLALLHRHALLQP